MLHSLVIQLSSYTSSILHFSGQLAEPPGPYTEIQFSDRHDPKAPVSQVGSGVQVCEVGFGLVPVQGDGEEVHVRV